MLKFLCLTVLIAGVCAAQSDSLFDERIVGGADAAVGQFPHQVSLREKNGTDHFCGGSIIGKRFILTAAHCTQNDFSDPKNVEVVVGAHLRLSGGTHHALTKIVNHPKYNPRADTNDVSVLITASDITYTKLIQPIALPKKDLPEAGGVPAYLSGWGKHKNGNGDDPANSPNVLQWTKTVTLSREKCIEKMGTHAGRIRPNTVCTTNPAGVGACNGDSGGPLITQTSPPELIGLVTWALIPCGKGSPDVYARVFSHLKFIRSAML